MKTKLTLLLALAISAAHDADAGPNLPASKASNLPRQTQRQAVPMIKPRARPAASHSLPKTPVIRSAQPSFIQPRSSGFSVPRQAMPAKPAVASGKSPASGRLPAKPRIDIRKVSPSLSLPNAAALREGREIVEGLKALDSLRSPGFQNLIPEGLSGHSGGRPAGPADPFANNGTVMREPKAPDSISGSRSGLTDIRGSSSRARQGTRTEPGTLTTFALRLATSGPHTTTTHIWSNGNTTYAASDTDDGTHITTEYLDSRGNVTGRTDQWTHTGATGSSRTTDTYDENGRFTGSETITTHDDSSSQSKSVAADGTVVVTESDGQGHVRQYESEDSRGTRSCDRGNGEVAMGGPVNGSGPSVAQAAGLLPLDLLRQSAEGSAGCGGSNFMTSGRTSSNQVRPIGAEGQTGIGGNQNPVPVNRGSTVVLPGPLTGGGDSPE